MYSKRHRETCQRGGTQRKDREEPSLRRVSQGEKQATQGRQSVCNPRGGRKIKKNKETIVSHTALEDNLVSLMVDSSQGRLMASVE